MKNNRYTPILVVIMALISFLCLSLGVSYSYVSRSKVNANAMVITTGNLTSSVTLSPVQMTLMAMPDNEGMAQENFATISLSKNNVYSVFYRINIGYITGSIPSPYTTNNLMPLEYIRVALYTMNGTSLGSKVVGPVSLAELPITNVDTSNIFNSTYCLDYGTFATGSAAAKYGLKVWIDENTPDDYDEYLVYLGVTVTDETKVSKNFYNLSGTVVNSSGTALNGAVVSFHNNKIVSTTNSSGAYSLNNVPNGTYTITVTYNGTTYRSAVHIKGGDSVTVTKLNNNTGTANSSIISNAYTNYTVPSIITEKNSLGVATINPSSNYTIPGSYVIQGVESLTTGAISLKLMLNADGTVGITKV